MGNGATKTPSGLRQRAGGGAGGTSLWEEERGGGGLRDGDKKEHTCSRLVSTKEEVRAKGRYTVWEMKMYFNQQRGVSQLFLDRSYISFILLTLDCVVFDAQRLFDAITCPYAK